MKLAVADVETTRLAHGERPRTLFWGLAIEGEEYRHFATTAKLWNFLARYQEPLCIYSHHDYDVVQALVDGAPLKIRDVRGGRVLRAMANQHEWRNSHALFPSALKEILEAAGFKKPGLEDLAERNRADTVDALEAFKLCGERYREIWGINPLGDRYLTAASCSFAAAERVSGKLPKWLDDREAYRGGRVEAFRVGACGEADCWDINSSYPASFLDAPDRDVLYYVDVEVETDGPCPLAWIAGNDDKLLFPAGRFLSAVWGSTYERYIRPHGAVKLAKTLRRVQGDLSWLTRLKPTIRHAYQLRQEAKKRGDGPLAYAAKIGLNSIYGRLGLKASREVAFMGATIPEGGDVTYYRLPGGYLSFKELRTRPAANYLFAGFITDNARGRLYDGLMRTDGEVFYCDTDSVYLEKGSTLPVPQGKELGEWKYEGCAPLWIYSAKDYVWGKKTVRKGGDEQFQWTLKRCIGGKTATLVQKQRSTEYDKRIVRFDGSTGPHVLAEW